VDSEKQNAASYFVAAALGKTSQQAWQFTWGFVADD
jgi:hypothetical protein